MRNYRSNGCSLALLGALILVQNALAAPQQSANNKASSTSLQKILGASSVTMLIPGEKDLVKVPLDKSWGMADQQRKPGADIMSYQPSGQNTDHEMVSATRYAGLQARVDAHEFMANMKQRGQQSAPGAFDFKVIKDGGPKDVTYEYTIKNVAGLPNQYEIQRVAIGKDALYTFTYHTRNVNLAPTARSHFIGLLANIAILDAKSPDMKKIVKPKKVQ